MALDQALISFKKLFNKPHTSPNKPLLANEALNVGFPASTFHIFAEAINATPPTPFWANDGIAEYVRLDLTFISGTDTASGRHAFSLSLPSNYQAMSSNPKAGTDPFVDNKVFYTTSGGLQVVPTVLGGNAYTPVLRDGSLNVIPPLDEREWFLYEFGGIVYQQTPPATGASLLNPAHLDAWIYIGDMADEVVGGIELVNVVPVGTQDGVNATFSMPGGVAYRQDSLIVMLNGVSYDPASISKVGPAYTSFQIIAGDNLPNASLNDVFTVSFSIA